ncbi:DUF7282 domain-containing protein [Halorussus halophilus]|uniref:DUF7282 domain-containing protein n=1 Tax=Halorussus halophilus TaxID=2650975 RepID=UPI001300EBCB|nr:PGF-CTERM sorting domain-containing protein [Halorussus halophilus]
MSVSTRTLVVAVAVVLAAFAGTALAAQETTTTTATNSTDSNATVNFPDQKLGSNDTVTVESATLPDGGFVVVYNQSGIQVGHSEYLSNGTHENVTISLNATPSSAQVHTATLFRNNGSESYNASEDTMTYNTSTNQSVSDVSYVYLEERGDRSDSSETTTTSDSNGATTTADDMTTTDSGSDNSSETTEGSSGTIPGFTPITGVVALVGALALGLRRR